MNRYEEVLSEALCIVIYCDKHCGVNYGILYSYTSTVSQQECDRL